MKEFYDLLIIINKDYTNIYFYLTLTSKITPYIHNFVFHVPDLIEKYRNISLFSMQGLEKSNDVLKKNFHSRSNRHIDTYC